MFRSLLRFSIKDVLWLTLVVALGLGWWADRKPERDYIDKLKNALRFRIGETQMHDQLLRRNGVPVPLIFPQPAKLPPELENEPEWPRDYIPHQPNGTWVSAAAVRNGSQFVITTLFVALLVSTVVNVAYLRERIYFRDTPKS